MISAPRSAIMRVKIGGVDGPAFEEHWLATVEALATR